MNITTLEAPNRTATYESIAAEYYDAARHPTCASLRELSYQYLAPKITSVRSDEGLLVEVGVGQSILAPLSAAMGFDMRSVVLIDSSPGMLSYSQMWAKRGSQLVLADAFDTGLREASVQVLVASLGDPYNTLAFWSEVARVLKPSGICLFTTPSYEWATRFREPERSCQAEFVRADGSILAMQSRVYSDADQIEMIENAGLQAFETSAGFLHDLPSCPAPKLQCVSEDEPVVRGYSVCRQPTTRYGIRA